MNNYSTRISFTNVNRELWQITGKFSEEFVVGFLYGGLYGKIVTNAEYNYAFEFYAQKTQFSFHQLNHLINRFGDYFIIHARLTEITKRLTTKDAPYGYYSMWLRFLNRETPNAPPGVWLTRFRTVDFLQGLLTALQAFNISTGAVIMTAPLKENINYTIDGAVFPTASDYEEVGVLQRDFEDRLQQLED